MSERTGKLLILVGTHGDEAKFGLEVMEHFDPDVRDKFAGIPVFRALSRFVHPFNYAIANPEAARRNLRFVDADLNRVAPGDLTSSLYEERRAAELMETAREYRHLIDIHCTPTDSGMFVIVTNPTRANVWFAMSLNFRNVVIWPSRDKTRGPLTAHHPCAVEIECGPSNDGRIVRTLVDRITSLLSGLEFPQPTPMPWQSFYRVDGKVMNAEADLATVASWREFEPVTHGGDTFCPILLSKTDALLANSPTYEGVRCHKARKINFGEFFSR